MAANLKAASELMSMYTKLQTINTNPLIKKTDKMKKVLELLCGLSDECFNTVVGMGLLNEISIGGDKEYANSEAETDAYLTKYTRLSPYKVTILERVKAGRKKAKLEV
jgi:hypothetical protein